jgi:uncharacterized protein (DUF2384 family)
MSYSRKAMSEFTPKLFSSAGDHLAFHVTHPAERHTTATRQRISGPALRTFLNIVSKWALSPEDQRALLGWLPRSSFYKLRKTADPLLSYDELERISLVIGIYKALHILFPEDHLANAWVNLANTNPEFGGHAPIERMKQSIDGLYSVRRLLDSRRGQ